MLLENVILQGYNMGWLREKDAFTILGYRESPAGSLLRDIVPPLKKEKYIWSTGGDAAIKKGQRILHLNIQGTKVILFNTWRQTFPGERNNGKSAGYKKEAVLFPLYWQHVQAIYKSGFHLCTLILIWNPLRKKKGGIHLKAFYC